jgi:YD repeat-containing protein
VKTNPTVLVFVAVGVALCGWSAGLHAQSSTSCKVPISCGSYSQWYATCIPPLPATAYDCSGFDFTEYCSVNVPPCAPKPECPTCNGGKPNSGASPIDFATGDTYITETDIRLPGLGGGLTLSRTWNSIAFGGRARVGIFGPNWTSNFEENVFAGSDGYMKYVRADGGVWSFGFSSRDSNGNPMFTVAGPATEGATLDQEVLQPNPNWTLLFQSGETRVFDYFSGKLLSITDRNGNKSQLTYDSSFRLVTVTDPAARHLYFSYASPSSYLVTGVTSDAGISLSYSYDSLGRLIQCKKPDNTTVSFQYSDPNANLVTAVLDSNGKILESHTYNNCGQGLTSARAGGVEAITVSYPPGCGGMIAP